MSPTVEVSNLWLSMLTRLVLPTSQHLKVDYVQNKFMITPFRAMELTDRLVILKVGVMGFSHDNLQTFK